MLALSLLVNTQRLPASTLALCPSRHTGLLKAQDQGIVQQQQQPSDAGQQFLGPSSRGDTAPP
eukprot:1133621-Pelagomonas_calceolata.AAC.1